MERFGEKSAQNIIREIQAHKTISLARFIYSLGNFAYWRRNRLALGKTIFRFINKRIYQKYKNLSLEDLQNIRDIGPKVAQSIYKWFHDEAQYQISKEIGKSWHKNY